MSVPKRDRIFNASGELNFALAAALIDQLTKSEQSGPNVQATFPRRVREMHVKH
jgi:hypothetical protein